jgi:REase_DpnII-MboI
MTQIQCPISYFGAKATILPWMLERFPSLEPEPLVIKYAGQKKNADFAVEDNQLVIEAKHARTKRELASVVKQLGGLKDLYVTGANIRFLLFLLLVEPKLKVDEAKIEADFSALYDGPPGIAVKVVENIT